MFRSFITSFASCVFFHFTPQAVFICGFKVLSICPYIFVHICISAKQNSFHVSIGKEKQVKELKWETALPVHFDVVFKVIHIISFYVVIHQSFSIPTTCAIFFNGRGIGRSGEKCRALNVRIDKFYYIYLPRRFVIVFAGHEEMWPIHWNECMEPCKFHRFFFKRMGTNRYPLVIFTKNQFISHRSICSKEKGWWNRKFIKSTKCRRLLFGFEKYPIGHFPTRFYEMTDINNIPIDFNEIISVGDQRQRF